MDVIVRGPLLSVTGYGVHSRQVWRWARSQPGWNVYANITPWGVCTYYIDPDEDDGTIGDVMSRSNPVQGRKFDLSLQIQLPDEWDPELGKKNVGITAGIEGDRCNLSWIEASRKMDKVIVPSEYSKVSFLNGGLEKELIVNVPEAITCGLENQTMSAIQNKRVSQINDKLSGLSTKFNFLMFGQLTNPDPECDRKNTINCLRWLCETFKNDSDVGIILKTNLGRQTQDDKAAALKLTKQVIDSVREGPYPRVHLLHGLMDKYEIGAINRHPNVRALVAPTRGEGWGLPLLDAAASGLPIIATGCTGHVDFLKHVKYLDVKYTTSKVPEKMIDGRIWVPGVRWYEPSEKHFKHRITKFRKSPAPPKEWAEEAKAKIREKFNIDSVMSHYDNALGDLL